MKTQYLVGKTITECRAMTWEEAEKVGWFTLGTVIILSDGTRFYCTGLKSETYGEMTDAPAIPVTEEPVDPGAPVDQALEPRTQPARQ